jgi:hypothetical protein
MLHVALIITKHFQWLQMAVGSSMQHTRNISEQRKLNSDILIGGALMANDEFNTNLMRAIVAELHVSNLQNASREMFGKSYFSLGIGDKSTIRGRTIGTIISGHSAGFEDAIMKR